VWVTSAKQDGRIGFVMMLNALNVSCAKRFCNVSVNSVSPTSIGQKPLILVTPSKWSGSVPTQASLEIR